MPLVSKEHQAWEQSVPCSCRQLRSCNPLQVLIRPSSCKRGSILLGAWKWGAETGNHNTRCFRAQEEACYMKAKDSLANPEESFRTPQGRQGKRKRLFCKEHRQGKESSNSWRINGNAQWLSQGCGIKYYAYKAWTISQELEKFEVEQILKILPLSHSKKGCILVTFCSRTMSVCLWGCHHFSDCRASLP